MTHEDVTGRRLAEATISHMARHDALTNLPNRLLFQEALTELLNRTDIDESIAVLSIGIETFSSVKETLGYAVEDELLKAIARRLRDTARGSDLVTCLGRYDFAIIQTRLTQPFHATALAVRLIEAIHMPFDVNGQQIIAASSVGIALAPSDGTDALELLNHAGMAFHRAKAHGPGAHRYFKAEMDVRMRRQWKLVSDLREALANKEFELFYQPVVDIGTEEIAGFEALIRWNHPECGLVEPDDFIPLAEKTGLIAAIGEWAICEACKEAANWPDNLTIAVNLSPTQITSRSLIPVVRAALIGAGIQAWRLELEITESILLRDNSVTMDVLHELHRIGVRISMDDFGTGYSSFGYLRKFPFNKIKIDRCFISELPERDDNVAIVRAVSEIAASLGISTTAEGVETRQQFELVKNQGCKQAQGYLFGAPVPSAQIACLLKGADRKTVALAMPSLTELAAVG